MKLINLILLLLPLTGFSQVDTLPKYDKWIEADSVITGDVKIVGNKMYTWKRPEPTLYKMPEVDTLPSGLTTSQDLQYYRGSNWYTNTSTEIKKGIVELPIQVMDSGMKVEVVETRDTVYECPYNHITYFTTNNKFAERVNYSDCDLEKVITTRRYKLYIINEYGQKEYLSMQLTKTK